MADTTFFKVKAGLALSASATSTSEAGSLRHRASDGKLVYHDGSSEVDLTSGGVSTASELTNVPSGGISATDVQAAIDELDSEKEPTVTKGNLTEATSSVLTVTGGTGAVIGSGTTIEVTQASSGVDGFLDGADWTTFNNKLDDVMTTNGDIIYENSGPQRLAAGSEGQVLTMTSGVPAWGASSSESVSQVLATGGSGHGSTGTKIRRFTSSSTTGTAITYASDATNGDTFTVNSDGVYAVSYQDTRAAGGTRIGLSVNSAQLTTNIDSITAANHLKMLTISGGGEYGEVTVVRAFSAADVIRAHDIGNADATAALECKLTIVKVA